MSLSGLLRGVRKASVKRRSKLPDGYYVKALGRPLTACEAEAIMKCLRPCDGYFIAMHKGDQEGMVALKHWWRVGFNAHSPRPELEEMWPHAVRREYKRWKKRKKEREANQAKMLKSSTYGKTDVSS